MRWVILLTISWLPIAYGQWSYRFLWRLPLETRNRSYTKVANPPKLCSKINKQYNLVQDPNNRGGEIRIEKRMSGMAIIQPEPNTNPEDPNPSVVRFVGFWPRSKCSHLPTLMIHFHPIPGTRQFADFSVFARYLPGFNLHDTYPTWAEIPHGDLIFPDAPPGSMIMKLDTPEVVFGEWEGDYIVARDVITVRPMESGGPAFNELVGYGTTNTLPLFRTYSMPKDESLVNRYEGPSIVPVNRSDRVIEGGGDGAGVVGNSIQEAGEMEILKYKPGDNENIYTYTSDFEAESRMLLAAMRDEEIIEIMRMIETRGPKATLEFLEEMMASLKLSREINLMTEKEQAEAGRLLGDKKYTNRELAFFLQLYRIETGNLGRQDIERNPLLERQLKEMQYSWDAPAILITLMIRKMERLGLQTGTNNEGGSLMTDFLNGLPKGVLHLVERFEQQYQSNPDLEEPAVLPTDEIYQGAFGSILNRVMELKNSNIPEEPQMEPQRLEEFQIESQNPEGPQEQAPEAVINSPSVDDYLDQSQASTVLIEQSDDDIIPEPLPGFGQVEDIAHDVEQQMDLVQGNLGIPVIGFESEEDPVRYIDTQPMVDDVVQDDSLRQVGINLGLEDGGEISIPAIPVRQRPSFYSSDEDSPRRRPMTSFGRPRRNQMQTMEDPSENRNIMEEEFK
ncbi:hypothetical protein AA313_de0200686 [Arthrobotrys entomopaga]|nr:hypothetical protein AA313_de0200686 [Arthrobotrys entomopaga]